MSATGGFYAAVPARQSHVTRCVSCSVRARGILFCSVDGCNAFFHKFKKAFTGLPHGEYILRVRALISRQSRKLAYAS